MEKLEHKRFKIMMVRVFKDFNYSFTLIINVIFTVVLFSTLVMGLMGLLTGGLFDRYGMKPLAIIGVITITSVTYLFSMLSMETPYVLIIILYTIRSVGLAALIISFFLKRAKKNSDVEYISCYDS